MLKHILTYFANHCHQYLLIQFAVDVVTSYYCQRFESISAAMSSEINWPQMRFERAAKHSSTELYRTSSHFGFRLPSQLDLPIHFHIPRHTMARQPAVEFDTLLESSTSLADSIESIASSTEMSSASSDIYMPKLVTVRIQFNQG